MSTNKEFIGRHSHTFDTLENFNAKAPVLESGELVVMKDGSNLYFKVGCEKTAWSSLPKYEFLKSYTTGSVNGTISINGTDIAVKGLGTAAYKNIDEILSGNSSTASKLKTARTIALTGSVTGSGTFDGSDNLTITTTTNHTHSYLPLTGGTLSGGLNFSNGGESITWNSDTWQQRIQTNDDSIADTAVFSFQQSSNTGSNWTNLMVIRDNGKVIANTFVGELSGNASTATKLTTARTISLSGSVTGSGTFDGSGNLTITTTTNHTHSYLPLSGGTITGATQFNNYLKLNAWSGYGTGTANFWYDANNKFVAIQNATDLKLDGTKVSKEGHTHLYAGSSSAGGSANSSISLQYNSDLTASTVDSFSETSKMKIAKVSNYDIGWVAKDGIILSLPWSDAYCAQIAIDDQSNWMGIRTKNNGTWSGWSKLALTTDNVATATALTTSAGSATQPVYFSNGKPTACTYSLNKTVPSDAKFTDTNTWRGIQDNLTSTSTTDSLSANQGRLLANGSARDNTKLPLTGGTIDGYLIINPGSEGNWTEGIRINMANNNWATIAMGCSSGSTIGTGDGIWSMHVNPSKEFVICHNGSVPSASVVGMTWSKTGNLSFYSNVNVDKTLSINNKVTMQYNSSTESLDFVFA